MTRLQLEQLNDSAFYAEVEKFAAGDAVLTKDNFEAVSERMLDHAEHWTDGLPVDVDASGMIVTDNAETFSDKFKRDFNADTEDLASVAILIVGFLVFYGLTGLVAGGVK